MVQKFAVAFSSDDSVIAVQNFDKIVIYQLQNERFVKTRTINYPNIKRKEYQFSYMFLRKTDILNVNIRADRDNGFSSFCTFDAVKQICEDPEKPDTVPVI